MNENDFSQEVLQCGVVIRTEIFQRVYREKKWLQDPRIVFVSLLGKVIVRLTEIRNTELVRQARTKFDVLDIIYFQINEEWNLFYKKVMSYGMEQKLF
ncbi:MAG: hypothetical protein QM731_26000 [Chitinophagaceae bacterium]